jgi:predicted transglutaminase-like protease
MKAKEEWDSKVLKIDSDFDAVKMSSVVLKVRLVLFMVLLINSARSQDEEDQKDIKVSFPNTKDEFYQGVKPQWPLKEERGDQKDGFKVLIPSLAI